MNFDPPTLAPLPPEAERLLRSFGAPPRLVAHLRLVHDVALKLTGQFQHRWPTLSLDKEALCFGAATHDIGKVRHPVELTEPGSQHERTGETMLLDHGVSPAWARFARTHARWPNEEARTLEDLLVALADSCWKGKRSKPLEETVIALLATATSEPPWSLFLALDDILAILAADADERLAWMATFPAE